MTPLYGPEADYPPGQEAARMLGERMGKQCRRELLFLGLGLFLYMLSTQACVVLLVYLINGVYPLWYLSTWVTLGVNGVSIYLVGTCVMYLTVRRVPANDIPGRGPMRVGPGMLLRMFCASYACAFFANLVTVLLSGALEAATGSDLADPLASTLDSATSLPALAFYMVLLAPFVEELVFRRILLFRLRKYGDAFAITVSAACFGLFHANLHQMLYAFVIGLVFAYIALRTGGIACTVLLHAMVNALGLVAYVMDLYASEATLVLYSLFILAVIIVGVALFFAGLQRAVFTRSALPLREGQKWRALLLNPGFLLFLAFVARATFQSNFR